MVGPAYTLPIPMRDISPTPLRRQSCQPQRAAIEQTPAGHVCGDRDRRRVGPGRLGDILAARSQRGVAGVVSDGAVRDSRELCEIEMPIFCAAFAAPPSFARMMAADAGRPIGCGGVAVFPGDIVVADDDGVVVIARHLAAEVARDGLSLNRNAWKIVRRRVRSPAHLDRGLVSAQRCRAGGLSALGRCRRG
jgi:regulator of RNase E activity RraA